MNYILPHIQALPGVTFFIKLYIKLINWLLCAGLLHPTFGKTWPCHFHMNTIDRSLIEIISNISFPETATSPSLPQHPPDGPTDILSPVTQTNLADGTRLNNASQRKMSMDRPFNRLIDRWMKRPTDTHIS